MKPVDFTFWQDLGDHFSDLPDGVFGRRLRPGWALQARDNSPESSGLLNHFAALAVRGGMARGARREDALDAWVDLLAQRAPQYFASTKLVVREHHAIAKAQIDEAPYHSQPRRSYRYPGNAKSTS